MSLQAVHRVTSCARDCKLCLKAGHQLAARAPPDQTHPASQEMPSIRFRTPKPPDMDADEAPVLEARSLVSQRIAAELDAILSGYQASRLLPQGPRQGRRPGTRTFGETCCSTGLPLCFSPKELLRHVHSVMTQTLVAHVSPPEDLRTRTTHACMF